MFLISNFTSLLFLQQYFLLSSCLVLSRGDRGWWVSELAEPASTKAREDCDAWLSITKAFPGQPKEASIFFLKLCLANPTQPPRACTKEIKCSLSDNRENPFHSHKENILRFTLFPDGKFLAGFTKGPKINMPFQWLTQIDYKARSMSPALDDVWCRTWEWLILWWL